MGAIAAKGIGKVMPFVSAPKPNARTRYDIPNILGLLLFHSFFSLCIILPSGNP